MIMIVISFALVKFYAFAILYVLIVMQIKLVVVVVVFTFVFYPPKKVCFANQNIGQIHPFISFLPQF